MFIVDAYSNIPKFYGMENITTSEVMDKLDMLQSRFRKIDQFGWWGLERISADLGKQFTLTDFKEKCQTRGVSLTLAALEHQEMNGQVEVTWRTLCAVVHALMVHARVPEVYVHFALMYTTDHIFRGWRSNNTTQTGNRYETFSVTFMCFILSVCCMKSYGAR